MATNATVTLPAGATNHGDPNLVCVPPSWADLASFFGTNYLAHAATLIPRPGQSLVETAIDTANALFIPGSGMIRAIRLLFFYTDVRRRTPPLTRAARAGALCMIVKRAHVSRAISSDEILPGGGGDWFSDSFSLGGDPDYVPLARSILGTCIIRDRRTYCLVQVSPQVPMREFMPEIDAPLPPDKSTQSSAGASSASAASSDRRRFRKIEIPGRLDVARILVSILQLMWGISTLYDTRGNQISLYGYGSFGLTVAPYAVMSFLNLLVSLVLPAHNNMYLVWTQDAKEAMETLVETSSGRLRRAGEFYGMVATVDEDELAALDEKRPYDFQLMKHPRRLVAYSFFYILIAIIPLAIVGAFTGFETGSDVRVDRAWILAWLIVGSASAVLIRQVTVSMVSSRGGEYLRDFLIGRRGRSRRSRRPLNGDPQSHWFIALFILFPLWIPAIGGMVVVGQMLREFGICSRF